MKTKLILKFVGKHTGQVKYYEGSKKYFGERTDILTGDADKARRYVVSPHVVRLTTRLRKEFPQYDIKPEQVIE